MAPLTRVSDRGPPAPAGHRRGLAGKATIGAIILVASVSAAGAADAALGEYLAGECMGCHQLSGSTSGGIPRIVGKSENDLIAALNAYKAGKRENSVMRNIAERLTDEEIAALAAFFAAQKQQ